MGKDTLIIVESNGKVKKIEKLTGHKCVASFGHIFALKPSLKWFDPKDIKPEYIVSEGKEKILKDLVKKAKAAKHVIIASDLDREGEAIAAHLMSLLKLNPETTQRITFNQITESALKTALASPGRLDKDLYFAQQARAVIDLVFGFTVSPFLSKHLNIRALSAGRCQSPAIRLCMERQREQKVGETKIQATAETKVLSKISHIGPELKADELIYGLWLQKLVKQKFRVNAVNISDKKESPPPPFITSSLQQAVYSSFGINPKGCMSIAQKLYEDGYITYMRTDSVSLSEQFQKDAIKWIDEHHGKEFVCKREYSKRGDTKTQDAHEAIRPIDIEKAVPSDSHHAKVYELIRNRAVASQMSQALYKEEKVSLSTKRSEAVGIKGQDMWESVQRQLIFQGWRILKAKNAPEDELSWSSRPSGLRVDDKLDIQGVCVREHAKTPPAPYNPASLVKMLEKTGIGRPSTYSTIIERIQTKGYVTLGTNPKLDVELREWSFAKKKIKNTKYTQKIGGQNNVFIVSDLGEQVCEFFETSEIEKIVNSTFTSSFEDSLDKVASGKCDWKLLVQKFHKELTENIAKQPPPKRELGTNSKNWVRQLKKVDDVTLGVLRTQYGLTIAMDIAGKTKYANMPPSTTVDEVTIEEAEFMLKLPVKVQDNLYLKIGKYGWYVTDGSKNVSLGKERKKPSKKEILEAYESAPENGIVKKIDEHWSLRRKGDSYYLMYLKGNKPIFYSVKDPSGKWTVARCEEYRNKKK